MAGPWHADCLYAGHWKKGSLVDKSAAGTFSRVTAYVPCNAVILWPDLRS